jgi:hypothetical protein
MTIYFENCIGACSEAAIDLPDKTRISEVIDRCIKRWGYGSLSRVGPNKELIWRHDMDEVWIGCCAEKIARLKRKGKDG